MTAHQDPDWLDDILFSTIGWVRLEDGTIVDDYKDDATEDYAKLHAAITAHLKEVVEEVIGEDEPKPIDGISSHARQVLKDQQRQRLAQLLDRKDGEK